MDKVEYMKKYRKENKEAISKQRKEFRESHKEEIRAYDKEYKPKYYQKNKERIYDKTLKWKKENPEKWKEYQLKYYRSYNHYGVQLFLNIIERLKESKSYQNRKLLFTKEEFIEWLDKNDTLFKKLYNNWVESNYDKKLSPSIDRIDNDGDYSLDNIQLITVIENIRKTKAKLTMNQTTKIKELYKSGDFTQKELGEKFGVSQANISYLILNHED